MRLLLKLSVLGLVAVFLIAADAKPTVVLLVIVNGIEASEDIVAQGAPGHLVMLRRDLVSLGLPLPQGTDESVPLDTLPGVSVVVDLARQIVRLDFRSLDGNKNRVDLRPAWQMSAITPSATGLLVNYDLSVDARRGGITASGLVEARLFSGIGTLSTSALANSGALGPQAKVVRLETTYTAIDPTQLRRFSAGDIISGSLTSSRAVRLAGLQVSTDFSIRPDLITYPVPLLTGSAAVPSTIDVLVNGTPVGKGRIIAGDFSVAGTPIVDGAGTVVIVLRDALGRERRTTFNVYGVRTLLAPGLSECTGDLGLVRRNYGLLSNDYRLAASTVMCRWGISNRVTLEGHGEATADLVLASGGAVLSLGRFGIVSAAVSASIGKAGATHAVQGGKLALSYEVNWRPISLSIAVIAATQGYRDIAVQAGDPPVRTSIVALVGFDLGRSGRLGVSLARHSGSCRSCIYQPGFQPLESAGTFMVGRTSLLTATYSAGITRRVNLYGNMFRDFERRRSTVVMMGLSVLFGQRTIASASVSVTDRSGVAGAQLIRSVTEPGGLGYRLMADEGIVSHQLAEATYRGSSGEIMGGLERADGQLAGRVGLRGALVVASGDVLAGNTLDGSFAIVDAGIGGVSVLRDNRLAGVTNTRGLLLLPNLRAYQSNRLAIDPLTLPDDVLPATTELSVRPGERTGVVAMFAARLGRSVRIRLVDGDGVTLRTGDRAKLNRLPETVPVGFDGEIFFSNVLGENHIEVVRASGMCTAVFAVPDGPLAPVLGPIACR